MFIIVSQVGADLVPLIQKVNADHEPLRIISTHGDAVLMSAEDFDAWRETVYLLRSPANAERLMEAIERDRNGSPTVTKSVEALSALAGDE
ncbi:antitoxin YefM [Stackebrandtia albiflava]|uniref:Antitoxin n=1 Tax=Stackebrandtia albiflava TaxID=406432 RepID=A0A562V1K4_9ACTN|nr:type II toxin-antitoxin system Phd/YefM family antitoxin [Stackebrandtia albiflava]TWJ11725.1 antitoxin YefM [Stackebrandtia albiflava]